MENESIFTNFTQLQAGLWKVKRKRSPGRGRFVGIAPIPFGMAARPAIGYLCYFNFIVFPLLPFSQLPHIWEIIFCDAYHFGGWFPQDNA